VIVLTAAIPAMGLMVLLGMAWLEAHVLQPGRTSTGEQPARAPDRDQVAAPPDRAERGGLLPGPAPR
jgi:hypothetical protein